MIQNTKIQHGENMNLVTYTVTGTTRELIKTEIMFFIASAKATGQDLIKLELEEKQFDTVTRILRSAKRGRMIQLFILSDSLEDKTTEVEYLKNKYPNIERINAEKPFCLLKV